MTGETKKAPYGMITGTRLFIAAAVAVILYFSSTLFNARTQMNLQQLIVSGQQTIISNQEKIIGKLEAMQTEIEKLEADK